MSADAQLLLPKPRAAAVGVWGTEAFTAGSNSHPDVRNWQPSRASADADILPNLYQISSRSRDLERNHGVASGAAQTLVDNILGTGLWLAPTPRFERLGMTREWAKAWRKQAKMLWQEYSESFACDAADSCDMDGLGRLNFHGAFSNGDAVTLPLWLPRPMSSFSTRLQVIESDRLCNPMGQMDTPTLRGGIAIDEYGAAQSFWIRKHHPGDIYGMWGGVAAYTLNDWENIPALTSWGRRRVIYVPAEKTRAGQSRGVPALAAVLRQFKVLGDYQNAELKAAVVNAMVALVTESALGQEQLVELLSGNPNALKAYQEGLANRNRSAIDFNGGMVLPLMLGEKISAFTPARPSTAYDPFVTSVFRHIATGLNIPYELLMKDFSKTNYSSARAALLEAWRFFAGRRDHMAKYFYQPVYELFIEEMVNAGELDAPDFYKFKAAYCRARWYGPGRGWIDPVKEGEAAGIRMDRNLSTLEAECAEQGRDWEEVLEQRAEELAVMKSLGISPGVVNVKNLSSGTDDEPPSQANPADSAKPGARQ